MSNLQSRVVKVNDTVVDYSILTDRSAFISKKVGPFSWAREMVISEEDAHKILDCMIENKSDEHDFVDIVLNFGMYYSVRMRASEYIKSNQRIHDLMSLMSIRMIIRPFKEECTLALALIDKFRNLTDSSLIDSILTHMIDNASNSLLEEINVLGYC